eukprot:SAG31_NODE_3079_length_4706_cov_3.887779_4_plen_132_part_00
MPKRGLLCRTLPSLVPTGPPQAPYFADFGALGAHEVYILGFDVGDGFGDVRLDFDDDADASTNVRGYDLCELDSPWLRKNMVALNGASMVTYVHVTYAAKNDMLGGYSKVVARHKVRDVVDWVEWCQWTVM